ncbi:putative bifunctional diguanylate cyclase/phosphodiesterase [Caproiciproducens faecalis]|uniref:GGDEF domain-containing protein n=1 Tax=Caproiciproducens faecalis TaxID=2820301 RepID=A0ABS7DKG7_9FIRM|nr:bifunctional diguanylate cyclase/phosphodiesterase [Caproiciproducens faecalis]MBW7571789.1 GGDEF domain-containing protein [Caproiciproducens faecalis]
MKKQFRKYYSKSLFVAAVSIIFVCLTAAANEMNLYHILNVSNQPYLQEITHQIIARDAVISAAAVLVYCGLLFYICHSRRQNESNLEKMAYYDSLTGLSNIYKFEMDVGEKLAKNPAGMYCIFVCDLNNMAVMNDLYGHQAVDQLLCRLARAMTDVLKEGGLCARNKDGSFLVFLQCKNDQEAIEFLHCFSARAHQISNVNFFEKQAFSFGIYRIRDKSIPVRKMIDRASLARETTSLNSNYAFFDEAMRMEMKRNREMEDQMEEALKENQFTVYYQPKYRLPESTVCAAEALVRWNSPKYGMLQPSEFIPIFEKNGSIIDLDLNVLSQVCRQLREWLDKGLTPPPISINISRMDLYRSNFVDSICRPLNQYEIPPNMIELELTESAVFSNIRLFVTLTEELHRIGFRLSMDDFGTGYSSLNTLKCLRLDTLKLDRGFFVVCDEEEQRRSEIIVNQMIGMAKQLNITTVSEGIETEQQVEFLKKAGCDQIQGFYFAKPMPVENYEKLVWQQEYHNGRVGA